MSKFESHCENIINQLKQYVHMADQVTDTKFGSKYFTHTDWMSGFRSDNKKDVSVRGVPGRLKNLFYGQVLNRMFWSKFSICDLIWHAYILFGPVYHILHNKIQIWPFDSNNRIDMLWEFNYVIGLFIRTDPTWRSGPLLRMACTSPIGFNWFVDKITQWN